MSPHDTEDQHIGIEVVWCPGCRTDCTVEVIAPAGDPEPVGVCADCGLGIPIWWFTGAFPETRLGLSVTVS